MIGKEGCLHDFLGAVGEVLLDLVVGELEDLQAVGEGGLRGPRLRKVVDDALVRIGLLDVVVVEVDDGVAVGEHLALDAIVENHLFLSIFIHSLDLSIVSNNLLDHLHIRRRLAMVLHGELHVELLALLLLVHRHCGLRRNDAA